MRSAWSRAAAVALVLLSSACIATPSSRPVRRPTTTTSVVLPSVTAPNVWSTPAAAIATSPRTDEWADRYFSWADAYDQDLGVEFGLDEPSNDYSLPVYSAADATTVARVFRRPAESWYGRFDIEVGATIPWNPAWKPADGTDGFLLIVDPATGQEWDLWALSTPSFSPEYLRQDECIYQQESIVGGYDPSVDLCAAAVMVVRSPDGQVADIRTYRGNYPPAGGGGLHNTVGLTTPEEVAAGVIPHALKFAVSSRLSMTGPACPPDVTSPDDPRVGTTCGISVAPAGKFESARILSSPEELARMVPDGTRLVLDLTDAEIEAWLDGRGFTGELRRTARTFAVALRDYGLIQTSTTSGPATVQVSGGRNAETAEAWRRLGIVGSGSDLLAGLFTRERIRVLAPPTNHCDDGASRLACWASNISY